MERNGRLSWICALVVLVGCASGGEGRRSRGAITAEELTSTGASDCFEAVRALRPQWLRARAAPTPRDPNPEPRVIVDGTPRGGLAELSLIPTADVESIRFMGSSDATTRFGTGYPAGAIEVRMRRR